MKLFARFLVVSFFLIIVVSPVKAAPTTAVLGGGVAINEFLIDPVNGGGFDTDSSGTFASGDEFIELYNLSGSAVDISGWQIWDAGARNWFTFPGMADDGTTVLAPGAYAVVVVGVQTGGTLPTMSGVNDLVFDNGRSSAVFNNSGGDNVVVYDPGANEYIQALYNGATADNPPVDYAANGFSATATRVGPVEDWGSVGSAVSLTRYPSGDTAVSPHNTGTPGGTAASPTAVSLQTFRTTQAKPIGAVFLLLGLTAVMGSLWQANKRAGW